MYQRVLILVADGARDDLMRRLIAEGCLPNLKKHVVDRGCYRTALTVYPSTTGPAHIPFVCGLHPGSANIPGYRWLDRFEHDRKRRSIHRHRSLNSPRGLMVGRDMNPARAISLYEYFENPSSVLELIDYCPNQHLYKIIARRLFRIVQAHHLDDWSRVDKMVEQVVIKRIRAGSRCIIGSFFGIDEYSHLHEPFDQRTIGAYLNIDRAVGEIAEVMISEGVYHETIIAIVSDHGLSATSVHIPLVDITKQHGFNPYCYPKLYRRSCDSAVCESGNAMAQIYFRRGEKWGSHWNWEELRLDPRCSSLIDDLVRRDGVTFVAARDGVDRIVFIGRSGTLCASRNGDIYSVTVDGTDPLGGHPVGRFTRDELFHLTYDFTYPDAVNQLFMLFSASRSGDIAINAEPGFDLRLQYEDPEHHASHGSLHKVHMQVPLMISVPLVEEHVANCDLVPTILHLTGKKPRKPTDGRLLSVAVEAAPESAELKPSVHKKTNNLGSILATTFIIVAGIVLSAIFNKDITRVGEYLLSTYGQNWVDGILFLLTAVSSTPLVLPIWAYAMIGVALGYGVIHLAIVMALGSATGSLVSLLIGKYFGETAWMKRRFPEIHRHPWTYGRSKWYVTLMLFLGTASPLPCDVFYVACGVKRYPAALFWVTMVAARFVRYCYLGLAFKYAPELFQKMI
ncbi:MAG: alkaline phosphatase family protein [Candidatus Zixiibacteriota bacterium]